MAALESESHRLRAARRLNPASLRAELRFGPHAVGAPLGGVQRFA